MPEGVGRNRIGVCVEDPIDLSAGQMAITASWEQIGVICLRSTPEILTYRIHHLVTEVHYARLARLIMTCTPLEQNLIASIIDTIIDNRNIEEKM